MLPAQLTRPAVTWPGPQWLALFYDLAFAAGIIALSGSYGYDYSGLGALWFAITYGILASVWLLTGGATGGFTTDQRTITTGIVVLVAVQMTGVLMLALASGDSIAASSGVFDVCLALLLATVLGLAGLARGSSHSVPFRALIGVAVAMVTLGLAWVLPEPFDLLVWILALAILGLAAASVALDARVDLRRLAHRLGELTIIIIGEILVKVTLTLGEESLWSVRIWALVPLLVFLVAVWWAYFTGPIHVVAVAGSRRVVWITAHWGLHVALLGLAVGLGKLLVGAETLAKPAATTALLTAPVLLMVASLAVLDWITDGPRHVSLAIAAVVVAVVTVTAAITEVPPGITAYTLAAITLAAVAVPLARRRVRPLESR
ncbi:MAG: low temperature requirement protein A [Actinobacteria bacterium]|nr:low temperature requirement protein A [Actinomycetota bacterium]